MKKPSKQIKDILDRKIVENKLNCSVFSDYELNHKYKKIEKLKIDSIIEYLDRQKD